MKKKQKSYLKVRALVMVMICLIIGMLGSTSVFAETSDIPAKGWDRLIGGSNTDALMGIATTSDGGFVAVGSTIDNPNYLQDVTTGDMDGMIVKTDNSGTTIWTKVVGGTGTDILNSVATLSDGSILAVGSSSSSVSGEIQDTNSGISDCLLVKYDSNGVLMWTKLIGGSRNDGFSDVIPTADGGFLAVGIASDTDNGGLVVGGHIAKFNEAGNIQWHNYFYSPGFGRFSTVIQTSDGGFVTVGTKINAFSATDGLVVKYDSNGEMVWNKIFGSSKNDEFAGITATSDGGFLVVGKTAALDGDVTTGEVVAGFNSALAVKFNNAGIAQWNRAFTGGGHTVLKDVFETKTGNFVAIGSLSGGLSNGLYDGFISNLSATGNVISYSNFGGTANDEFNALVTELGMHILVAGESSSSTALNQTNGGRDGLLSYFGQPTYNVTFNENGGTNLNNQVVSYGEHAVAPTSFQKPGYTFEGWYVDEGFSEQFPLSAPILQDTSLFAKWYVHITMNNIVSEDRSISGVGEPGLKVIVSLADGTKIETKVNPEGKWLANLPKEVVLKSGTKVIAAMYDSTNGGVEVSAAEKVVTASNALPIIDTPKTGDMEDLFPVWLFGLCLGLIIMRRAFKGPKVRRRY